MRGRPDLAGWGAETLAGAEVVYAGSEHIRDVLEEVVRPRRSRRDRAAGRRRGRVPARAARRGARRAARGGAGDPPNPGNGEERLPDEGNAGRFARFFADERPTVVYFGKLIENKGVQVLLEALAGLDARAVVVGFGDFRERARGARAARARSSPGSSSTATSAICCRSATSRSVPSIFPEAFGMVAAEAAAAGVLPVVSAHSGLAEVAAGIGEEVGPEAAALLSFPAGDAVALRRAARRDPRAAGGATTRARPRRAPRGRAALELDSGRRALASNAQVGFSRGRGAEARVRGNARAVARGVRGRARFHALPSRRSSRCSTRRRSASTNRFEELQASGAGAPSSSRISSAS